MKKIWLSLSLGLFLSCPLAAWATGPTTNQDTISLTASPMVGYAEYTEVMIWVQTSAAAEVKIKYWRPDAPEVPAQFSSPYLTDSETAFTAHIKLEALEAGQRYQYEVWVNQQPVTAKYLQSFQTQTLWRNRSDPPNFTVALGSCVFVNDPDNDLAALNLGGDYHIFQSIHRQKPDLMLWLGDNTYLLERDFYSATRIDKKYRLVRTLPELQPLLSSVSHYAIWDDHDYGSNDADRSYRLREASLKSFKDYWANPSYGLPQTPGVFTRFEWGDAEFFLTDNRYHRAPNKLPDPKRDFFGEAQFQWLKDSLASSTATFKIIAVGNEVLNTQTPSENFYSYQRAYRHFLSWLKDSKIPGILLVSGDRHHSELFKLPRWGTYPLYELSASPLTSKAYPPFPAEQVIPIRVPGTLVETRNFGLLKFRGPKGARRLEMQILNANGESQWRYEIEESELRP